MPAWFRKLIAGPVFEDEEKTRTAALLNAVLLTTLGSAAVGTTGLAVVAKDPASAWFDLAFGAIATVVLGGLLFLTHRGHVRAASVIYSSFLIVLLTAMMYAFKGIRNPAVSFYFVAIAVAALLLGGRAAIIFGVLSALATLGIYYAEINGAIIFAMPASVEFLDWAILALASGVGALLMRFAVHSINAGFERAYRNAQDLAALNRELIASQETLQVQARDLMRRARYLEATAAVAREATSVLDLQELLSRAVTLISERFAFYHTGIFLLDPTGEWAELSATSSEGGRRMLARSHRLRVGEQGIVGYVTSRGESRIALDTGKDAAYFDNPDLPETRSEIALPLRVRGKIIGALDVQSTESQAFSEEDAAVLQTLADQVAVAISNARLFQQAQEALEAERRAYAETSRRAWAEMSRELGLGYLCNPQGMYQVEGQWRPEMIQASQSGQIIRDERSTVAIPLKVRDQTVGVVRLRKPEAAGEWTAEEIALMETLSEQLGVALESARLYQDTQRRAVREQLTSQITSRMRESLDVETVLSTAAQEISAALGLMALDVRLSTAEELAE